MINSAGISVYRTSSTNNILPRAAMPPTAARKLFQTNADNVNGSADHRKNQKETKYREYGRMC